MNYSLYVMLINKSYLLLYQIIIFCLNVKITSLVYGKKRSIGKNLIRFLSIDHFY